MSPIPVFPHGPGSKIDGKEESTVYKVEGWGETHRIKNNDTIEASGPFSLAINTWDKQNDTRNKNGVYEIRLYVDSSLVYHHNLEKFDFSETRYINSLIDYPDTRHREELMFMILKSSYLLADQSVPGKQRERFQATVDEYLSFKSEFPESEYIREADRMYRSAQKILEGYINN